MPGVMSDQEEDVKAKKDGGRFDVDYWRRVAKTANIFLIFMAYVRRHY